jgi:hypothetical protein
MTTSSMTFIQNFVVNSKIAEELLQSYIIIKLSFILIILMVIHLKLLNTSQIFPPTRSGA